MQADGIIAAQALQHLAVPAGQVQEIFAVDFEPVDPGAVLEKIAVVGSAQADAHHARQGGSCADYLLASITGVLFGVGQLAARLSGKCP